MGGLSSLDEQGPEIREKLHLLQTLRKQNKSSEFEISNIVRQAGLYWKKPDLEKIC
jgi:hypothetical protein